MLCSASLTHNTVVNSPLKKRGSAQMYNAKVVFHNILVILDVNDAKVSHNNVKHNLILVNLNSLFAWYKNQIRFNSGQGSRIIPATWEYM